MKKIFLSLAACAGVLTSCDMNTTQYGVIDDSAKLSYEYVTQDRNYSVYSCLRGCTVGSWLYDEALQLDQFIGLNTNGGRGGNIANGNINSSNGDTGGKYAGMYSRIAQVNYAIEKAEQFLAGGPAADQAAQVNRYIAEMKFARAYYYFYLFDHYCPTYVAANGDKEGLGLSLVTVYNPTGDTSKYPGRSSQNATLALINGDLDAAFNGLAEFEKTTKTFTTAGSHYLSTYAVAALQARVALVTGQYETAIAKADYVIGNSNYSLATGESYIDMWHDANVSELIFTPFVDQKEVSSGMSTSQGWNYWWPGKLSQVDYIPTQATVLSFGEYEDAAGELNDVRLDAFFTYGDINTDDATAKSFIFNKYPGNDELIINQVNYYINTPKPFRLSEQYLIKAEAAALKGDAPTANTVISDLVKARLWDASGFVNFNLSGDALLTLIRKERTKELIGEGFHLSDMRRWKLGFDRNQPYQLNAAIAATRSILGLKVKYTADDYRYVWPIPYSEMQINPQLAGQQNSGY